MPHTIIIHGSPGNGKTTLAKALHQRLKSPWFEFGWIPEFRNLTPHTEMSCADEETMSFESLMLVVHNYIRHGFQNIILTDLNDVRLRQIPREFAEHPYIILTLTTEDEILLRDRILHRTNGNAYKDVEQSLHINRLIRGRKLLPNEYRINSTQTPDAIMEQVMTLLQTHIHDPVFDEADYDVDDYFSYTS